MKKDFDFTFAAHLNHYPPVIPRIEVQKYFPWLTAKRLANLDSLGEGPAQVIKNGRAILYPTGSFLKWLDSRSSTQHKNENSRQSNSSSQTSAASKRGRKTKQQEVRERRG